MKLHRTLTFTTLLILVLPLTASIAIQNAWTTDKMQGAGQATSFFGRAWQRFSSGNLQLARNSVGQSKEAVEQTNSTSIPTQMPLPPVTAPAPKPSNNTNLILAAIAIAVVVVVILIWRFRRKTAEIMKALWRSIHGIHLT